METLFEKAFVKALRKHSGIKKLLQVSTTCFFTQSETGRKIMRKRLFFIMVLTITFVFGCVSAHLVNEFIIPPAKAGVKYVKWEYLCERIETSSLEEAKNIANEMFNKAGHEGWEVATTLSQGWIVCFKRPAQWSPKEDISGDGKKE